MNYIIDLSEIVRIEKNISRMLLKNLEVVFWLKHANNEHVVIPERGESVNG